MPIEYATLIDNLIAIIIIDLVLAGDNAILIALATKNLPQNLQRKAIMWGTVGAIVIRTLMTILAVQLLKIPGLSAVGGLALLYIAYQLITDDSEDHAESKDSSFWAAMRTIIIADAVMGIDNVLAVAGASEGNIYLVVAGLLISIPIVVFGSQLVLGLLKKYTWLIYVGGAVLIITGVKMISHEKLLEPWFNEILHPYNEFILMAVSLAFILGIGMRIRNNSNKKNP
jgi:YjbE family integral membrane protein